MPAFRTVVIASAIFAASALSDDEATCKGLECSTRSDGLVQTSFTRGSVLSEEVLAKALARVVASRTPTGDEKTSFLNAHNQYRCMHGSDPVTWSDAMANDASSFISDKSVMEHSQSYSVAPPAGPAGENLFSSSAAATPQKVVDAWYSEVNDCAKGTQFTDGCAEPATGKMTGHFTAMIWKGVKEIGCAFSDAPELGDGSLIICRYKAGDSLTDDTPNMNKDSGNYVNHVFPATKTKAQCPMGQSTPAPTPATTPAATPAPTPPSGGTTMGCVKKEGACTVTTACSGMTTVGVFCDSPHGWAGVLTLTMPSEYKWDLGPSPPGHGYCSTCELRTVR